MRASFPHSSNVVWAEYEEEERALTVGFRSGTYVLRGVEPEVAEGLLSSPSPGSYYARQLKGAYPTERL